MTTERLKSLRLTDDEFKLHWEWFDATEAQYRKLIEGLIAMLEEEQERTPRQVGTYWFLENFIPDLKGALEELPRMTNERIRGLRLTDEEIYEATGPAMSTFESHQLTSEAAFHKLIEGLAEWLSEPVDMSECIAGPAYAMGVVAGKLEIETMLRQALTEEDHYTGEWWFPSGAQISIQKERWWRRLWNWVTRKSFSYEGSSLIIGEETRTITKYDASTSTITIEEPTPSTAPEARP